MFLQRTFSNALLSWQQDPHRKPLIIRGARQVGKSSVVKYFAKNFENFLEINFEKQPEFKRIFESSLVAEDLKTKLEVLTNSRIIAKKTLLFLDEVQECPRAITALRYFYEELPELHVIAAGSLMQLAFKEEGVPVGRVSFAYLHPFSFYEFLSAIGENRLREYLERHNLKDEVSVAIHDKLLQLLKEYFIVGGMPEAIARYKQSKNLRDVSEVQVDLLSTFRRDFRKYTTEQKVPHVEEVFSAMPRLIGEHYKFTKINPHLRTNAIKEATNLLIEANILYQIFHSSAAGLPLGAGINPKKFKINFLDIGLALKLQGLTSNELVLTNADQFINKGALAEQFFAQEMLANGMAKNSPELYFWQRESTSSAAEVDFLIQKENQIIPIEVKSGAARRSKSLGIFIKEKKSKAAFLLSTDRTIENAGVTLKLPIYFAARVAM